MASRQNVYLMARSWCNLKISSPIKPPDVWLDHSFIDTNKNWTTIWFYNRCFFSLISEPFSLKILILYNTPTSKFTTQFNKTEKIVKFVPSLNQQCGSYLFTGLRFNIVNISFIHLFINIYATKYRFIFRKFLIGVLLV